ncbi:hypothetical protein [Kitasatospora purpeofusca]|uniref:hypothetical protein n=1 Tax=Kitasatospora purpeofusca TaxID=67352 RepID=UPI0022568360|nr:hypothetical protein [Kitasatospora purpeofusca]MCX4752922.1 hypothetical protein [Kitasatospora purpeofusca]WSR32465.1 hypothetical protein OG715_16615 [Kitasatospora purpeofusca]WSR40553.1 hypothetical protein OG196_16400 [Kitasatospora purpeofusca]
MTKRTARQEIERAFHVSFKLPEEAAKLLDAYRDEVREEVAQEIDAAGLRNRAEYPDLDAILDAADQDGWWTMPRPQVEQLIAEVRRLQADRDEMAHLRDAALRALHRDDIDTNLDVERAIADNLCGPGWWDDDTPSKVARELTPVIRPALAKATQQRDQALARVRELETQLTKYVALDLEEPDGRISATCPDAALDAYRAEVLAEGAALIRDQVTSHTYCADRLTSARTPAS